MNAREIIQRAGVTDETKQQLAAITCCGNSKFHNVYVRYLSEMTGLDEADVQRAAHALRMQVRQDFADYIPQKFGQKSLEEISKELN
jgi:Mn-dependent DtxR family transcriptional regulator